MTTDPSALEQLTLSPPELAALPFDATGLTGAVTPEEAVRALPHLRRVGAAVRWLHGDIVLALIDGDTSRLHEAWQQIADLDLDDRPSLMRSVAVAIDIPRERRRAGLSWSHHAAVFRMEPEAQDRWLAKAEADGLTVDALTKAIAADGAPEPDEPLFPEPKPWRLPPAAVHAIGDAFRADPTCAVVLRADGTWRVLAEPGGSDG